MRPDIWKKNALGEINAMGFVILFIDFIIFGVAKSPTVFAQSALMSDYSPTVRGLIFATPGFLIGLYILLLYSRVEIDFKEGILRQGVGVRPIVIRKQYSLKQARKLILDGSRGRSGVTYRATIVFDDKPVALTHGDGFLRLEDVENLTEWLDLPVEVTPRMDEVVPDSFRAKLASLAETSSSAALSEGGAQSSARNVLHELGRSRD